MRLALLLSPTLLVAQASPRDLPWRTLPSPPWQACEPLALPAPCPPVPPPGPGDSLRVRISMDGALRVSDAKGILRLRLGLPGRPARIWRDGGEAVDGAAHTLYFPKDTPLSKGLGGLPWDAKDFRTALVGLLWILDDGQRILTVVHPATGQYAFIPLPDGPQPALRFHPERLELRHASEGETAQTDAWFVPWIGLLPQFIRLGPQPPPKPGTALQPFAKE